MNPSLGLLLPLMLGQPASPSGVVPAAGLLHRHSGPALAGPGCDACAGAATPAAPGLLPPPLFPQYMPLRQPCPPVGPPAPILAVKAILPGRASLVLDATETGYGTGSVFGFRPGYVYRLKIGNLPAGHPGDALGATLEVYGSIVPRPNMRYMEFPAALYVTDTDVLKVLAGGVVTKVIYLENPEKAIPQEERPDQPIEVAADTERDAVETADANGRIVAVLRIGDRPPTRDELAAAAIDGTVLLPGASKLGLPAVPPHFGCSSVPLYDPILGPKPTPEECLLNGGDGGDRAGIGPGGRLGGLDVTDVVAEYTRGDKREATVSNVVCLCSPRFVMRRVERLAGGLTSTLSPGGATQVVVRSVFKQRAYAEEVIGRERTLGLISRQRPAEFDALTVLHALGTAVHLRGFGSASGVQVAAGVVQPDELTSLPNRLVLTKSVEPTGPYQPGDVVTITLKYANNTLQPLTDMVISDSLSGRLEYVPGSAAADRPSNVTTEANEAGSSVIKFDIPGPIPPAGTGVVVFKVKVR